MAAEWPKSGESAREESLALSGRFLWRLMGWRGLIFVACLLLGAWVAVIGMVALAAEPEPSAPTGAADPVASRGLRWCRGGQLSLSLSGRDGEFTGMSHDGVRVNLRNASHHACALAETPLPFVQFLRHGIPLELTPFYVPSRSSSVQSAGFMRIDPGKAANFTLYWVDEAVYGHNLCHDPHEIRIVLRGPHLNRIWERPLKVRLCGPALQSPDHPAEPVRFRQSALVLGE